MRDVRRPGLLVIAGLCVLAGLTGVLAQHWPAG